ncbi:MAG: hypothetical protein LBS77_00925 [Desulfovibrio sp.]|nr:hypothetical protein [Desulfovibrio sp.]
MTDSTIGIDRQLTRLERVMMNADKSPTKIWVTNFFANFPWLNGFAGVKYDGSILGQEPASPLKQLDFIPLLYADNRQNNRALRADVQNTPFGPEVMLAVPLYNSTDFLGVIVAHFDMRTLAQLSGNPSNIVILSPQALLWPGKYDYAATPLSSVNWADAVTKSSSGVCKNATGSFYYLVRYFANLPLIFAVPESGSFPEGAGDQEQAAQYFPKEREKLPPPPIPERKSRKDIDGGQQITPPAAANIEGNAQQQPSGGGVTHDIQPGSRESVLLKGRASQKSMMQEGRLENADAPVERVQRPRRAARPEVRQESWHDVTPLELESDPKIPALPGGRPSPFGPREDNSSVSSGTSEKPEALSEKQGDKTDTSILPGGPLEPSGPQE